MKNTHRSSEKDESNTFVRLSLLLKENVVFNGLLDRSCVESFQWSARVMFAQNSFSLRLCWCSYVWYSRLLCFLMSYGYSPVHFCHTVSVSVLFSGITKVLVFLARESRFKCSRDQLWKQSESDKGKDKQECERHICHICRSSACLPSRHFSAEGKEWHLFFALIHCNLRSCMLHSMIHRKERSMLHLSFLRQLWSQKTVTLLCVLCFLKKILTLLLKSEGNRDMIFGQKEGDVKRRRNDVNQKGLSDTLSGCERKTLCYSFGIDLNSFFVTKTESLVCLRYNLFSCRRSSPSLS